MRDRIWFNLQNAKFKSIYLAKVSKSTNRVGNLYSFFLAIASASSVAAWTIWQSVPSLWGAIVAISQFLHIAKPYIPYVKHDREYMEMSHQYDKLYLSYEKLWFKYVSSKLDSDKIEEQFYLLRGKEMEFNKRFQHIHCPEYKKTMQKSSEEAASELALTFK